MPQETLAKGLPFSKAPSCIDCLVARVSSGLCHGPAPWTLGSEALTADSYNYLCLVMTIVTATMPLSREEAAACSFKGVWGTSPMGQALLGMEIVVIAPIKCV